MSFSHIDNVGDILRAAAAKAVLPRFTALLPGEIRLKSAQEPVTAADLEAERMLQEELGKLLPQARFVGEEACSANPDLLRNLARGLVWLVDPLDGTRNFANGREPFAMMVALLQDGAATHSWILDPRQDWLAVAELGGGAWADGVRLYTNPLARPIGELQGIVSDAFVPKGAQELVQRIAGEVATVWPTARCAGYEYPSIARGERDFAVYWRTLAWDHAPGALFLTEAGGRVCHWDGSPYRPAFPRPGLLLTTEPATAERLLALNGVGQGTGEAWS